MLRGLCLGALLLLACRDPHAETLATARGQYEALLAAGTPAQSRDFDKVRATLESIPEGSKSHAEAQKLLKALAAARGARIERPLAVAAAPLPETGAPGLAAELDATRKECERLAQQLPEAAPERRAKLELLDACRRRADTLTDAIEHASAPDGGAP